MSEIRVCENCKFPNNINNLECEKCGFDLSFVIPIDERELEANDTAPSSDTNSATDADGSVGWMLTSADGTLQIQITDGLVIGRDGIYSDFFEKSKFVSRKHAVFYVEDGKYFVLDASTNGTFLNDARLPKLTKIPIQISDKITFADVSFEVRYAN